MYKNEDALKNMLELFANPLFQAGFTEFANKAQQEGVDMAKKFWGLSEYSKTFPYSGDVYERMTDWYKALGFVPTAKYSEVEEENTRLKAENQLLRNMIKDLQLNYFSEGSEKAQQAWHDIIDKQIKTNAEVANTFFEAIRQFKAGS
jgi:DnaJ-domain-containing protein 1